MAPFFKLAIGCILLVAATLLFLMEFKAFPYRPKNPEKWDDFYAKNLRSIRLGGRMCLLMGLSFVLCAYK